MFTENRELQEMKANS